MVALLGLVIAFGVFYMVNTILGLVFYYLFGRSLIGFLAGQAVSGILMIIIIPFVLNLTS